MAERGFVVAIVGAAGEVGIDLRDVLMARSFPTVEWRLYDDRETILAADDFPDIDAVGDTAAADLADVDLVFLCGPAAQSARMAMVAAEGGAVVIDLSQALAMRDDVALIVPEVNAEAVAEGVDERRLATPLPAATALAVALAPIEHGAHLRRVTVTCLEPVSSSEGGVEELARQTSDLLSGREAEPVLWPVRIAFNLIPQVGDIGASGASEREWQMQRQLRRILDLPDLPVVAHVVRVPTFYGLGMMVTAETEMPIDGESAVRMLHSAPGLYLHGGEGQSSSYPTLSDAVGSEATHVGRVREDPTVPCGLSFWVTIDGLRKGTTVNAAQIAECVVRELRRRG